MTFAMMLLRVVVLGVVVFTVSAFAEDAIRAQIPFAFQAGDVRLPGGVYLVATNTLSQVLWLRNEGTGNAVMILTLAPITRQVAKRAELRFRTDGSRYYLSSVWNPTTASGRELPKSRAEREAIRAGASFRAFVLAAQH